MNFLEQIITAEVKWRLDRLAVEDYFDARFPNTFAFEIHGFQDFLQENFFVLKLLLPTYT